MLPAPPGVPFRGRRHPIVSGRASACHQRQRPCRLSPCEGGGLPHLCGQPPRAARFEERAGVGASVGCGSFWPTLKLANTAGSFRAGTGGGPDSPSHWLASSACPLVTLRTATGTGMWLARGVSVTSSIMTLEDEKRGKPTMETPGDASWPSLASRGKRLCAPRVHTGGRDVPDSAVRDRHVAHTPVIQPETRSAASQGLGAAHEPESHRQAAGDARDAKGAEDPCLPPKAGTEQCRRGSSCARRLALQ